MSDCPHCGHDRSRVIDSRRTPEGLIRRRRGCRRCHSRFTTLEASLEELQAFAASCRRSGASFAGLDDHELRTLAGALSLATGRVFEVSGRAAAGIRKRAALGDL